MSNILPIATMDESNVEKRLITLRGESVLIDADVAALYGVETREVNQAVRRNLDKFPQGYFFDLTKEETDSSSGRHNHPLTTL